jgi:protein O-GlcNAc transferase
MSAAASEHKSIADALALLSRGDIAGARRQLETLANTAGASRAVWHALASACSWGGDFLAARTAIERAIQIGPVDGNLLLTASNIAQDQRDLAAAIQFAERAVTVEPGFAQGYNNLGILLSDAARLAESEQAFLRAIALKPDYARAFTNLAAALLRLERYADSVAAATKSIALQPDYAHAHYGRGAALFYLARYDESLAALERAVTLDARIADAWMIAARIFKRRVLFDKAEIALSRVLALTPQRVDARVMLGEVLWNKNRFQEALALWQAVATETPQKLEPQLRAALSLPGIYRDAHDIDRAREGVINGLKNLRENAAIFSSAAPRDLLRDIQFNNFFLAYQGRDDKSIQRDYADFVAALLTPVLPQFFQPVIANRERKQRIRIGFVGGLFYSSTVGNYFASWITDLPRDAFEVIVFHTGEPSDAVTKSISNRADKFMQADAPLEKLAAALRDENLDILVYPELGMDAKLFALAAMRLAPVQVCAWGHPITPGHRNIDYFLSCAEMEPENAQQHYSEKLHLLPGLGTRYAVPATPAGEAANKRREDFLLPTDKTLYLLPQSLFKIHPDNDALFTALLKQDPNAVLVMFAATYDAWTEAFVERLSAAFGKAGIATAGRVKVLPNMSHDDYKRINQFCDVMIDTLYWSGGNTSLDAIAMGLPMVTMRGEFMRGRQSAAMLSLMGLDELIANDHADYLRIALRLGTNLDYRREMAKRITDNRDAIFNDPKPIAALVEFFKRVAHFNE